MSVLVLGLNHRCAPVSLLERVAVAPVELPKALLSLRQREHVLEAVVLSTCNRVEVYAHVTRFHGGMADLRNFFAEWGGVAPEEFADLAYDFYDHRAAAHLFAVAAGLDSMVLGERQIQLQVKAALRDAQAEGAAGRVLGTLFGQALRVGRRARAETHISDGAASMVDAGLDAARRAIDDLAGRTVLVVGAGKMGGMAAARVRAEAARVLVTNRTSDKAERLAERVGGDLVAFDDLAAGLRDADVVLTSTGAAHPVVAARDVATAMAARPDRPLVLIDLAVPRDVDPACAAIPGVTVLDIDDIRAVTDDGRTGAAAAQARVLVEDEVGQFAAWTRSVRVEPTIAALRSRAEAIRQAELRRLAGRLVGLDDRQAAAVDALTRGILATLLHDPSVRLKAVADAKGGELYAEALRELFDLPE